MTGGVGGGSVPYSSIEGSSAVKSLAQPSTMHPLYACVRGCACLSVSG